MPASRRAFLASLTSLALAPLAALAEVPPAPQDPWPRYLQVFSLPDLPLAQRRARELREQGFDEVSIFHERSGYYAVTAGLFDPAEVPAVEEMRRAGLIPADSFLTSGRSYRDQMAVGGPSAPGIGGPRLRPRPAPPGPFPPLPGGRSRGGDGPFY